MAESDSKPPSLAHINVPITRGALNGVEQDLVYARDLHAALKVGREYSHWIRERIQQLGLAEGSDYTQEHWSTKGDASAYFYYLHPLAALRLTLAQRAYGAPSKDAQQSQLTFLRERLLSDRPAHVQVLRYLAVGGLSDAERASLAGLDAEQWRQAVADLIAAGLWADSGRSAVSA